MTLDEYSNHLKKLEELISQASAIPSQQAALNEVKMKFITKAMPMPSFTITWNWNVRRGQMIELDRNITMNPFDVAQWVSSTSNDLNEIFRALDLLKEFMHEYIDMRCPNLS